MNLEKVNTQEIASEPVRPEKLAGDYSTVAVATKLHQLKLNTSEIEEIDQKLNGVGFEFADIAGTNFLDGISEDSRREISSVVSTFNLQYKYDLDKKAVVEEFAKDLAQVVKKTEQEVTLH